jgi:hypothetical protein
MNHNLKININVSKYDDTFKGCKCIDVEVGSYDSHIRTSRPKHMNGRHEGSSNDVLCVDSCLYAEILTLWYKGIHTTGCCCGHNKQSGYIGVIEEDIDKMLKMGYIISPSTTDYSRRDSFFPKSVGIGPAEKQKNQFVSSITESKRSLFKFMALVYLILFTLWILWGGK